MATLIAIIFLSPTASQTTQCVWNSMNEWSHLNGEYLEEGTFDNGHNVYSYWKRLAPSCIWSQQYLYAVHDDTNNFDYWFINHQLTSDEPYGTPTCGLDSSTFPSDPSQCENGWIALQNAIPLTVTHTACPSLPCDAIRVTNSGDSACDQLFTRDDTKDNVYEHNKTYLYFNPFTFKWHCSYSLHHNYCGVGVFNASLLSSKTPKWFQMSLSSSFNLEMSNNASATLQCLEIDTTTSPIYTSSTFVHDASTTINDDHLSVIVTLPGIEDEIESTLNTTSEDTAKKDALSDKILVLSVGGAAMLCFCVLTSVKYLLKLRREKDKREDSSEDELPNEAHHQVYIHTMSDKKDPAYTSGKMTPGEGPAIPDSDPLHLTVVSKYEKGALGSIHKQYEKGKIAKIHPHPAMIHQKSKVPKAIRLESYSTNNPASEISSVELAANDKKKLAIVIDGENNDEFERNSDSGSLPDFVDLDKSYKLSESTIADVASASSLKTDAFEQHVLQDMDALNELFPRSLSTVAPSIFSDYKPEILQYAKSREVILETCNDCGQSKLGKIYKGDGNFYCDDCWKNYYGDKKIVTVEGKLRKNKRAIV